jgi:hypothetical protein
VLFAFFTPAFGSLAGRHWQLSPIKGIIVMEALVEQVVVELAELNKKADVIIGIMQKPESRLYKLMEIICNAVGILGILAAADIIRNWIMGG